MLAYLCLFRSPALWGQRTGRPIRGLAARTFGVRGARWLPALPQALVQVVWLAVSISYGTSLCLNGLERLGLLNQVSNRPSRVAGLDLPGHLFLVTSLFWAVACALTGRYLVKVIAALMTVYTLLPAFLLGTIAAVSMRGLPEYQGVVSRLGGGATGWAVALVVVQMIFGFFSPSALAGGGLGNGVPPRERDVKLGGWVGVSLASWIVATLALLTVAGTFPRYGLRVPVGSESFGSLTFAGAVRTLIGGRTGGLVLIAFGLKALAPACYASYLLAEGMHAIRPRASRTFWVLAGVLAAWLLIVSGRVAHLLSVFGVIGAVFAPIAGALAADYVRSRGRWPAARSGWNGPGVLAWVVGLVIGLVPIVGGAVGRRDLAAVQPASVFAFLMAFVTYLALALLGGETPEVPDEPA